MNKEEFIEREFYINKKGIIFDNSLNINLEDEVLKVNKKEIKRIYENQNKEINEVLQDE